MNSIFISYIIPTYNAEKYIKQCLTSILAQDYPKDSYEILIADGGSIDKTKEIIKSFGISIINNPARDADDGKFLALEKARGQIVAMIDSDNIIVGKNWLSKMVSVMQENPDLLGMESNYLIKKNFSSMNKYANLLVIVDPLARVLASRPYKVESKKKYCIKYFKKKSSPVAGANGFLWRKEIIDKYNDKTTKKFAETNLLSEIALDQEIKIGNIENTGIYHYYCENFADYFKKRQKIARKFLTRSVQNKHLWVYSNSKFLFYFWLIYLVTFIGPFIESVYQAIKTKHIEWLLHPFISIATIFIYSYYKLFYNPSKNKYVKFF